MYMEVSFKLQCCRPMPFVCTAHNRWELPGQPFEHCCIAAQRASNLTGWKSPAPGNLRHFLTLPYLGSPPRSAHTTFVRPACRDSSTGLRYVKLTQLILIATQALQGLQVLASKRKSLSSNHYSPQGDCQHAMTNSGRLSTLCADPISCSSLL